MCVFYSCVEVVTLLLSSVVVLVNVSHCVNVVMVNQTAWTAVMSSTAVRYVCLSHYCMSLFRACIRHLYIYQQINQSVNNLTAI